jgi:hypothetical protein
LINSETSEFMFSFGTDNLFDPDDPIIGGAKKQISLKANTPGRYRYDAGTFYPRRDLWDGRRQQARAGNSGLIRFLVPSEDVATSSLDL